MNIESLVSLRVGIMCSKRPISNLSTISSSINEEKKSKKLKGLKLAIPDSEDNVVKVSVLVCLDVLFDFPSN